MKKVLASLLVLFVLMVGIPISAEAHNNCSRHRRARKSTVSRYYRTPAARSYAVRGYSYRRPSFYQRHRKKINMAVGIGGGAVVGGLMKGKKGALVGGILGAGAGALFNVIQKKRRY